MVSKSARERILMIRLLDKIAGDPVYAAALGIEGRMTEEKTCT